MDFIVHSFFVILSIGWGFNILFCILGGVVRRQRKADELWLLLYWPPPALGTAVTIQNLVQDDVTLILMANLFKSKSLFLQSQQQQDVLLAAFNYLGCLQRLYSLFIKWQHIQFTPESYHWLK